MLYKMKEVLQIAQKNNFALPAFNISSLPMLLGVVETAERLHAPVILEVHPDELSYVTPAFIETMKKIAHTSPVPIVIHLDHGSCFQDVELTIACGFTSVMIDGSTLPYDENVKQTKEVVEFAHKHGVSVEAELGTIGKIGTSLEGGCSHIVYTDPQQAKEFVECTGIDTLAIAIGTAHGIYPKGFTPKLQLDLLKEIRRIVDIPLVLHGGSSNADNEVETAVKLGICKVNISSDIKSAYFKEMRQVLDEHQDWIEPNQIEPYCIARASLVIEEKIKLFHADGKARLYT